MVEDKYIDKLPDGWTIITRQPSWYFSTLAWFYPATKRIVIYPPIWIPKWFGLRKYFVKAIKQHEIYHAWGHKGCNTFYCLMFECNEGSFEMLAYPFQFLYGFKLCKKCKSEYK